MEWYAVVAVVVAGLWAGAINAVVGSGTLVTFPTLIALGYPPVTATMSNAIGVAFGSLSGAWGYRRELAGQRRRVIALLPASLLGAGGGAWLLLHLPESAFEAIVPVLLVLALVLVVAQPRLQRRLRARTAAREQRPDDPAAPGREGAAAPGREGAAAPGREGAAAPAGRGWSSAIAPGGGRRTVVAVVLVTALIGVYGGYFAAAQGIMLVAALGALVVEDLQRLNALKNLLAAGVNVVAAVVYAVVGGDRVVWEVSALIAVSSTVGAVIGARYGRRLPAGVLRAVIVVVGTTALVLILVRSA